MNTHKKALEIKQFPNTREIDSTTRRLLDEHYEQYKTHVLHANELVEREKRADRTTANAVFSDLRLLKRELPEALAAVRGYELFLSQVSAKGGTPHGKLAEHLKKEFGSVQDFREELMATAVASRRWVGVVYDLDLRRILCTLGDTPDRLATLNQWPLLALEVTAGSGPAEWSRDRRPHLTRLLDTIDWSAVNRNLEQAIESQAAHIA